MATPVWHRAIHGAHVEGSECLCGEGTAANSRLPLRPLKRLSRRSYPQCSEYGHTDRRNRQSQASFTCRSCGTVLHADDNASRNVALMGVTVWTAGRESHVPATP
ncbi:zinc ribbon domain-containing protein [Streptomyces sp. NPDC056400]|uniref:zinc ribbon domain-containing protein n=1 Tax=Streptomyces sp. NPDC056400 TaxID=3345808 RepID=UPI0035D94DEA